jgi:hypothetical protein
MSSQTSNLFLCHVSPEPRLLMCGQDEILLRTRRMVLEHAGYAVDTVTTTQEARKRLEKGHSYRLLIICYTVPTDARCALRIVASEAGVLTHQLESLVLSAELISDVASIFEITRNRTLPSPRTSYLPTYTLDAPTSRRPEPRSPRTGPQPMPESRIARLASSKLAKPPEARHRR